MTDELNEITFCDECPYSGEPNGCNRKGGVCKAHDYCFDLRDERDALKAENSELRERLDKAVELPCKLRDVVYFIPTYNRKPIWGIRKGIIQMIGITRQGIHVKIKGESDFGKTYMLGKSAFLDKSKAKARLAELKGGQDG